MIKKIILCATAFFTATVFANPQTIAPALNMVQFQQCHAALQECPQVRVGHNPLCVQQTLKNNAYCNQLATLSQATRVPADFISGKAYGNLTLIGLGYPADGKTLYAVMSPNGQLIPLSGDPKKIYPVLAKQYPTQPVFAIPTAVPTYSVNPMGDRQFTSPVRLSTPCITCKTIGTGNIVMHFNSKGQYISAQLEQFSLADPTH